MQNKSFKIIVSFFCIWLTAFISGEIQNAVAFILILSFGILHGANDIVLLNKINTKKRKSSVIRFFSIYIAAVLSTVFVFYFIPAAALIIFILISAFHFGEQHWNESLNVKNSYIKKSFYFTYGFSILCMLFFFHQTEVKDIIFKITQYQITDEMLKIPFIISLIFLFVQSIYLILKEDQFKSKAVTEFFYLLLFAVIFKTTDLLWGFAIYFVFWHSIPSLIDQVDYLFGKWSLENFLKYCRSAFWYWMISISGIAILYFVFKDEKLFEAMFFSFLAAITIPHVWVIISMFKIKKEPRVSEISGK